MLQWVGIALAGSTAMGCVAQEKYNALKLDRDQYAQRLSSAEASEQSAQAAADAYRDPVAMTARRVLATVIWRF